MADSIPPAPKKGGCLKKLLIAGGVLFGLLALTAAGLLLYFNDAWFKERITSALRQNLGRDAETGSVHVSIWNGSVSIEQLRIPNAKGGEFRDADTLRCSTVRAQLSIWPALFSGGKNISGLKIELLKPEFMLERRSAGSARTTNISDLIAKFSGGPPGKWPKQTGLTGLDAEFTLHDGSISIHDPDPRQGTSRLEKIEAKAVLAGLGQPLHIQLQSSLATPSSEKPGPLTVNAQLNCIDAAGVIDLDAFEDIAVKAEFQEFDLPHLARYAGVFGKLADGKYDWTPGDPLTGSVNLSGPALSALKLSARIATPSAVSIFSGGKSVAGKLPGAANLDAEFGFEHGALKEGPARANCFLVPAGGDPASAQTPRLLDIAIGIPARTGSVRSFTVAVKSLNDLFNTGAAEVLGLKGQIGGALDFKAAASIEDSGRVKAAGEAKTTDQFVAVGNLRHPASFDFSFETEIEPGAGKRPESGQLSFRLCAGAGGGSLKVGTVQPMKLSALGNLQKLSADARLNIALQGREFWQDFSPLLKLANLGIPLEEELNADLQISGNAGAVKAEFNGTLQHQGAVKAPVRLSAQCEYDGAALADAPSKPFAKFGVRLKSAADKSLDLKLQGTVTSGKTQRIVDIGEYRAFCDLHALTALNKRLGAYVQVFIGPNYDLAGTLQQTGTSTLIQTLDASGKAAGTRLAMNTDLQIANFSIKGQPLVPGGAALDWNEPQLALKLGLNLNQDQKSASLSLKPLSFASSLVTLQGELDEADLNRLAAAAQAQPMQPRLWAEALPRTQLTEARVEPEALRRLQALGILPNEPLAVGSLQLAADYDPRKHTANVSAFRIQTPQASLNFTARAISVNDVAELAELSANPMAGPAMAALLPSVTSGFSLETEIKGPVWQRLRALKSLPADPPLAGNFSLKTRYDKSADRLFVETLRFERTDPNGPLASLDLTTEVSGLSGLMLANPGDLSSLLTHFDKGIFIRSLALSPADLCAYLQRGGSKDAAVNNVVSGIWQLGIGTLENVTLMPKQDVLEISATGRTPAAVFSGPQGAARKVLHSIEGTWRAEAWRVSLAPGKFSAEGTLNLDGAALTSSAAQPYFVYSKPAGEACKLVFSAALDAGGTLRVPALKLTGGPVQFEIEGLAVKSAPALFATLPKGSLSAGGQTAALTGLVLDQAKDQLRFGVSTGAVEIAPLMQCVKLPNLTLMGRLSGVSLSYDGSYSAMQKAAFKPSDKLTLKAGLEQLRAEAQRPGAKAYANIFGEIELSLQRLTAKLQAASQHQPDNGMNAGHSKQSITLDITSKTPGESLFDALKAPGLPLVVKAPVTSDGTLNLNVLDTLDTVLSALSPAPAQAAPKDSGGMSGIKALRVETSVQAPIVVSGGLTVTNFKAPSIILDNLKLSIPQAQCGLCGGGAALSEGVYDLATVPVTHSQKLALTNINLAALAGPPAAKEPTSYQPAGLLSASGTLSGKGFDAPDRATWNGALKITLNGLTLTRQRDASWSEAKSVLGTIAGIVGITETQMINAAFDIFSDKFGLFLNKLEFEPFEINLDIKNGRAAVARSGLVGKAGSRTAGLQVDFEGGIDLPKQAFAPEFKITLVKLPPGVQKSLRLDQLPEADRNAILNRFEQRTFEPVILKGSLNGGIIDMVSNKLVLGGKFVKLYGEISEKLAAAQPAQPPAQPGQPQPPPPVQPAPPAPKNLDAVKNAAKNKLLEEGKKLFDKWGFD